MLSRTVHFLRPTFVALAVWALLAGIASFGWRLQEQRAPEFNAGAALTAADLQSIDLSRLTMPAAHLTPREVVQLQLAGLSDQRPDGVGIVQCYALASPANRAYTGPLDRFGRMVRQAPFQCMAAPQAMLVGRPSIDQRIARVVVTIIDQDSHVQAFTFVLSRQQTSPFEDCWMTEAVLPSVQQAGPPEPVPAA